MIRKEFNAASAELKVINAADENSIALLRRAYHEIYEPAFPIAEEREALEKIESRLRAPMNGVERVILIAGKNLDDASKAEIAAIGIAYYYSTTGAGLLAYNAVAPEYQGAGFGRMMVNGRIAGLQDAAAKHGQELQSIIIEVNNPDVVSPEQDSMDPKKRIAQFEKWGAKKVPVDYVQPALEAGGEKSRNSLLMAYPQNGQYPDAAQVGAFVTGIWQVHDPDYAHDPDYKSTMAGLEKWGGFKDMPPPSTPAQPAQKPPHNPSMGPK